MELLKKMLPSEITIDKLGTLSATKSEKKRSALERLKQVLMQEERYKAVPIDKISCGSFSKGDTLTVLSHKQYQNFIKFADGESFDASCNGALATNDSKLYSFVRQILYNTGYTD
jgi:hypothetical protein